MNLFEISSLVIPILTAPIWLSILGWLNSRIRHQRRLTQYSQILANLPKGYERDRWQVIVDDQSKDARLAMRMHFDSDDVWSVITIASSVFIVVGLIFSEDFRTILDYVHVLWRYTSLVLLVGFGLFSIHRWKVGRKNKLIEALRQEKEIERITETKSATS